MFSTLSKREIIILATFNFSSANAFNLVTFKILSFGKELNLSNTTDFRLFSNSKHLQITSATQVKLSLIFLIGQKILWEKGSLVNVDYLAHNKGCYFRVMKTSNCLIEGQCPSRSCLLCNSLCLWDVFREEVGLHVMIMTLSNIYHITNDLNYFLSDSGKQSFFFIFLHFFSLLDSNIVLLVKQTFHRYLKILYQVLFFFLCLS